MNENFSDVISDRQRWASFEWLNATTYRDTEPQVVAGRALTQPERESAMRVWDMAQQSQTELATMLEQRQSELATILEQRQSDITEITRAIHLARTLAQATAQG
jgi:uncharacterized membrane protein